MPGELEEAPAPREGGASPARWAPAAGEPAGAVAGSVRDAAWEAEAERLRRDRPPHWG